MDLPGGRINTTGEEEIGGKTVEIAVRTMFTTHCYSFGGEIYHQLEGGGGLIGLRVVMSKTDKRVMLKLTVNGVEILLHGRYADDGRLVLMPLKKG